MVLRLRKYKLQNIFNSKPSFFLVFELLPITTLTLTQIKKNLKKSGFEVKFIRTKEALGTLKSQTSRSPLPHSVPPGLTIRSEGAATPRAIENLFKGNLLLVYSQSPYKGQDFLRWQEFMILVGVFNEGVFYHPKSLVDFTSQKSQFGNEVEMVSLLTSSTNKVIFHIQHSMISIIKCLDLIPH